MPSVVVGKPYFVDGVPIGKITSDRVVVEKVGRVQSITVEWTQQEAMDFVRAMMRKHAPPNVTFGESA